MKLLNVYPISNIAQDILILKASNPPNGTTTLLPFFTSIPKKIKYFQNPQRCQNSIP